MQSNRETASKPAWFYRLQALAHKRRKEKGIYSYSDDDEPMPPIKPEEFDEDLSDHVSQPCDSDCEYETDAEGGQCCKKHGYGDDRSETSGGFDHPDGPDQEYYLLKEMRTERKREIYERGGRQKVLEEQQEQHREELEFESLHIKPIQEAINKAHKQKKPDPLKRIGGKHFDLWSTDHLQYCPKGANPTLYIEFYSVDEWDDAKTDHPERKSKRVSGHIYMLESTVCDLDYFIPPKYPSTKTYPLPTLDENAKGQLQFIDDKYLTLKINPDPIFEKCGDPVPSGTPNVLLYYGECSVYSSQRARQKQNEKGAKRRSASPE
ncbi:hypothetical protein NW752_011104 [Fusarium irregulare]|uniref:Uncharacterized protein n=1 Tax=Fusarium irregulare TaxID=2494466 RepID=A0A9W8PEW8_9HYPO|nr:hypothetical protein NW766_012134 [Fusarium irregulare]KAJ4005776.1 hypothetical protein NW752_011104 [Fusarium irregulare]